MENNEFEKVEAKKKKNFGILKNFAKRALAKIGTVLVVVGLIFTIVGCNKDKEKDPDDTTNPGITIPVDPDDPVVDPGDPVIDPDDPIIDPDDPVIDPDDPVIDPDPENPGEDLPPEDIPPEDVPPEDIPPEDIPPEDKPPEEENPGQEDPSTEIPGSIDEVDEVDEINYFADEFTQILNENYFNDIVSLIGKTASVNNVVSDSVSWRINGEGNNISSIQVSFYYNRNGSTTLQVGNITFDNNSVNAIVNNNATPTIKLDTSLNIQAGQQDIKANLDLGKTVIQTIDADNTLEGDIWCSIGSISFSNGKEYRPITVYQITENAVEEYYMVAEAPSADPASIIANIQEGKYTTTSQSTEYTFAGEKIEQTSASNQNLATYNDYFDDDIELC